MSQPGTFAFQLPGELEKELEAKKGITKLMLLSTCVTIDYKNHLVTNNMLATPSPGMEVVLSQPWTAWSVSLVDLFQQTLELKKESDLFSIQFKYIPITMTGKTTALHMLNGNFATDRTNLHNEANSIDLSAFLPQKNTCMVEKERLKNLISKTKSSMNGDTLNPKPK